MTTLTSITNPKIVRFLDLHKAEYYQDEQGTLWALEHLVGQEGTITETSRLSSLQDARDFMGY